MRRIFVLLVLLAASTSLALAQELTEVGVQLGLSLEPLAQEGSARWRISFAAYAHVTIDQEWRYRVVVGSAVTGFQPFADIEAAWIYSPTLSVLGGLLVQSIPQRGLVSTARVGGRYQSGALPEAHYEFTTFPLGWRLSTFNQRLQGEFYWSANASADVTLGSPETGHFGGRLSLAVIPEPLGTGDPLIPLGGNLLLVPQLAVHLGIMLQDE